MIAKLTGTVVDIFKDYIIIDVHGVGYKVTLPLTILQKTIRGSKTTLSIFTHVTEDSLSLFGFSSQKELGFFELLLTVSKIGPKTALSVMNLGDVDEIVGAISKADAEFFLNVPRVGRKNAQRIIVELRSKIGELEDIDLTFTKSKEQMDLLDALIGFGFKKEEVKEIIPKLSENETLEVKITKALKMLGKGNR